MAPQPVWLLFGRRPISVHACGSAGSRAIVLTASGRAYVMGGGSAGSDDSSAGRKLATGSWLVGDDHAVHSSKGVMAARRSMANGGQTQGGGHASSGASYSHATSRDRSRQGDQLVPVGGMLPQVGLVRKKRGVKRRIGERRNSAVAYAA